MRLFIFEIKTKQTRFLSSVILLLFASYIQFENGINQAQTLKTQS